MKGLGIAALFGFVSLILSYGLFLPSDLKSFSLIAAVASMAGYALGSQSSKIVGWGRVLLVVFMATATAVCVVTYTILVQRGSGEPLEVTFLAVLLFGIFFPFTFLLPLVGVSVGKS
ncbi:hypothetical protein [Bradyrhizobium sp. sGM-13]|uniref:hypothetical protein n=1 Tax=Bradyrhizobium sp. sGM-13 TaxID=2831781 RepID=UPI001BCBA0E1|nr:hypothetical protein [Bradyrhizobium sp. sGM-13]